MSARLAPWGLVDKRGLVHPCEEPNRPVETWDPRRERPGCRAPASAMINRINAHRVTIQGFNVMGGQSDVGGQFNIGIFITGGDQNNILYNIVQNTLSVGICIGATNNLVEANLVQNNRDGIVIADTASSPNTGGCEILSDFAPNWLFGVGGETVAPSRGD